ncbi:MAG TPA: 6-phosphogluconolactonase [bacterium]|nr:6-phosphogluconolactonase [bacterium]
MTGPSAAPHPHVYIFPDLAAAAAAAAERVVLRCERAVAERGECALALAGGETPRALYARLGAPPFRGRIPWQRLRLFWGDERGVSPDDPRSNYRMARETLLDSVPVPDARIHRMPAEQADAQAAVAYAALLREHLPSTFDGWPRLDLVLLGLGDDAHTASLFPHAPALRETERPVVVYPVPHLGMSRMTLTPPVLNAACEVLFLVAGPQKARAVRAVLEGPRDPDAVPAQAIRPVDGVLAWIVDTAAASLLAPR